MSGKSKDTGFEDAFIAILGLVVAFAAIVLAIMFAVWILGIILFFIVSIVLPLILPACVVGAVMYGMATATYTAVTGNEYEIKINPMAPVVVYAAIFGLFLVGVGFPEKPQIRFDEKTNTRWAEIQWPWLSEAVEDAKRSLNLDANNKREFRVSELNEDGNYFIPKPRSKKVREAVKTRQQQKAHAYGPQPPLGWVQVGEREKEPAQQILEVKLKGKDSGIPYDLSFLLTLVFISLILGAPAVFVYLTMGYVAEERARALKEVEKFIVAEEEKRKVVESNLEHEKSARVDDKQLKDEKIRDLENKITKMLKDQAALTGIMIPEMVSGPGKNLTSGSGGMNGGDEKSKKDSTPIKPPGALGSGFL